jgi:pimeloyl-ACP methyl ester carboxylesterase
LSLMRVSRKAPDPLTPNKQGAMKPSRTTWQRIRRVWIATGLTATCLFVTWTLLAIRPRADARAAMVSDDVVHVTDTETHITFVSAEGTGAAGLLFFAGALVDPVAYAPIMREVAEAGYPAVLVRLPRRGAFGGADGPEVLTRGVNATLAMPEVRRWVLAGHSRGGEVAARLAHTGAPSFAGLVLVGTSHPRDLSLAQSPLPVTRVYGTRDTIADVEKLERNRPNLPAVIRDVRIDGGNHSQFGSYGFQPGDWPATISREEQQRITISAILDALRVAAARQ